ncbi:hypothetical protein FISHEDRAFT_24033, partial [Fistulina hepatica ATCC 64428]
KVMTFDYYTGLEKMTDNVGLSDFKLLKCGGRGLAADNNIASTKLGELAILCPSCPRLGYNLPVGWENTAKDKRWV